MSEDNPSHEREEDHLLDERTDYQNIFNESRAEGSGIEIVYPHGEIPYLKNIVHDGMPRDNIIVTPDQSEPSTGLFRGYVTDELHEASERTHVERLVDYFKQAVDFASQQDDEESRSLVKSVQRLLDGLVYLGDSEMKEAYGGIAEHWRSMIEAGHLITVIPKIDENRSSRYVALQVIEAYDRVAGDDALLQTGLNVADKYPHDAAAQAIEDSRRFILVDDTISSGNQMGYMVLHLAKYLEEQGLSTEQAQDCIEVNTVGRVIKSDQDRKIFHTGHNVRHKLDVPSYTYYEVPYDDSGAFAPITHSHSSTDNLFESIVQQTDQYLDRHGLPRSVDLPVGIIPPYEDDVRNPRRADLDERWRVVMEKYGEPANRLDQDLE